MAVMTALAIGSAVVGGISAASQASSARKQAKTKLKGQAAEAEKDRQLQRELAQKQQDRIDKSVASFAKYDFGAKPLLQRQQPVVPPAQPPAPVNTAQTALMQRGGM